jgi:hypothetical protein
MREWGVVGRHMSSAAIRFVFSRRRCKIERKVAHEVMKTTGDLIDLKIAEFGSVIVLWSQSLKVKIERENRRKEK